MDKVPLTSVIAVDPPTYTDAMSQSRTVLNSNPLDNQPTVIVINNGDRLGNKCPECQENTMYYKEVISCSQGLYACAVFLTWYEGLHSKSLIETHNFFN